MLGLSGWTHGVMSPPRMTPLGWAQPQRPCWVGPLVRAKGAHHTLNAYTHTHKCTTIPSSAACSLGAKHSSSPSLPPFFSLHLCLSPSLWGVCLSAERGDCSIAEKMYKMLSPLFCWAFSIYRRIGELYRKPLCSPLKMSTWIWSSCIANNHKCGLELRHTHIHSLSLSHRDSKKEKKHYLPCWTRVEDSQFMTDCIWLIYVWCMHICRIPQKTLDAYHYRL